MHAISKVLFSSNTPSDEEFVGFDVNTSSTW